MVRNQGGYQTICALYNYFIPPREPHTSRFSIIAWATAITIITILISNNVSIIVIIVSFNIFFVDVIIVLKLIIVDVSVFLNVMANLRLLYRTFDHRIYLHSHVHAATSVIVCNRNKYSLYY